MTEVWGSVGRGFGDLWAALHWCLRRAEGTGAAQHLSTYVGDTDEVARLSEMLEVTDAPAHAVVLTRTPRTHEIGYQCWATRYLPTRERWVPSGSLKSIIAYQLDGRSAAHQKNAPASDVVRLRDWAWSTERSLLRIGQPHTVRECLRMLCMSELFVGVCSGMGMLALSAGVPTYILEYEVAAAYWYGPNPARVVRGVEGLLAQLAHESGQAPVPLAGGWRSSRGCLISLHAGGAATWEHGHAVGGHWKREPEGLITVRWHNGHVYTLRPTSPTAADGVEYALDGAHAGTFTALKES